MTNSLYAVCLEAALRLFSREQFLLLRFEDLLAMRAAPLLRLLSNFTGLYTDDRLIRAVHAGGRCEAARARAAPLAFSRRGNGSDARRGRAELARARPLLERFFGPYNRLLREQVHPSFPMWGAGAR